MERTEQQNTWESSKVRTVRPGGAEQQGQDSLLGSGGDISVDVGEIVVDEGDLGLAGVLVPGRLDLQGIVINYRLRGCTGSAVDLLLLLHP